MNILDDFGKKYLSLTLEIEKHIPGYIDSYLGPPELRDAINATPAKSPKALVTDLEAVRDVVPDDRRHYLNTTLRALEGTIRLINKESLSYLEEVAMLYDIHPNKKDESLFVEAKNELDSLLPGKGTVAERLEGWRAQFLLQPDQIMPLIGITKEECRHRTKKLVELVDGENIEVTLVNNQPWGAYNWFLGNAQSLVEFNTDIPLSAVALVNTFAHEAYPGHHTEGMLKEKRLLQENGYWEQAAQLLHSPAAVIAEGIATTALEVIFPEEDLTVWMSEVLLPNAGISPSLLPQANAIGKASQKLRYVSGNAAILYHDSELNQAQTIEYIQEYALASPKRAEKSYSFITAPLYRSYIFTYTVGYDLIHTYQEQEKRDLFIKLLHEQVLPSQL